MPSDGHGDQAPQAEQEHNDNDEEDPATDGYNLFLEEAETNMVDNPGPGDGSGAVNVESVDESAIMETALKQELYGNTVCARACD